MSTQNVRLAFVGTGGIAQYHLNNLKKIGQSEVVGLCDVELPRAEALAKEFGGRAFSDLNQMLEQSKPQALMVCTPPFVRLAPIQAACARKLPFFCEKPPAFSLEDAAQVQAVIEAHQAPHSIGFMYRHKETTDRAKELLADQTLVAVRSTFVNGPLLSPTFPAWFKLQDKSGGPLIDQAIHVLDLLRYTVGDIRTVFAFGSNRVAEKSPSVTIHDTLNLALEFQSGLGGTHNHSWACQAPQLHMEVFCKEANLLIDLKDNALTGTLRGMKIEFRPGDDCYVTEMRRFLQAVQSGDFAPIRSNYRDAMKTLAVCVAALKSAETGQAETVGA